MMQFLGTPLKDTKEKDARVVVIPIPFESTTSYGKGTKLGPRAILAASAQVELFDEELETEPCECGIYTTDELDFTGKKGFAAVELIESAVDKVITAKKFPLGLGGEHTVTAGLVRSISKIYPNLHIVHLDAHADMRPEYEGTPWSHACVMHRLFEMGLSYTSIGIRSISVEEFELIRVTRKNYFFAHEIAKNPNWICEALDTIKDPVYLTLDVDVLDSGVMPSTGTPEPGGLNWYQLTDFIRTLMEKRHVVGADIVELSPNPNNHASDFTAAKIAYKIIGYWQKQL